MAELNGGDRLTRLEAARKELKDSFIVMAHLETKSAARIREHAEFIARHEQVMREIDGKLNALNGIVGRMQGGIESGPG